MVKMKKKIIISFLVLVFFDTFLQLLNDNYYLNSKYNLGLLSINLFVYLFFVLIIILIKLIFEILFSIKINAYFIIGICILTYKITRQIIGYEYIKYETIPALIIVFIGLFEIFFLKKKPPSDASL